MSHSMELVQAVALLVAANATPVIVAKLANDRGSWPLDLGYVLRDGERLFGSHKTWRGLMSGMLAATLAAWLMQLPLWVGAGFAAASLVADATSSMAKRRMKLQPGTECFGLDQLGEALLPLLLFAGPLSLSAVQVAIATVIFVMLDLASVGLRQRRWL